VSTCVVSGTFLFLLSGLRELRHPKHMSVERPPTPTEDRLPAWRRACLAYREIRDAGGSDQQTHEASVEAVQQVLPLLSRKEASAEAVNAVAYATKYHSEWFWKGAQHARKWKRRTSRVNSEPTGLCPKPEVPQ